MHDLAQYYLSYIDEIMSKTKQSTYHLLGWSSGGRLSLEIASILEERGDTKTKVYLLDTVLNDAYLEILTNNQIEVGNLRNEYIAYINSLGYDKSYIEKVISNMIVEEIHSRQKMLSSLSSTKITLFKALLSEDVFKSENYKKAYEYISNLKYNNVDSVVKHKSNIKVINVNAHHGNILDFVYKNRYLVTSNIEITETRST